MPTSMYFLSKAVATGTTASFTFSTLPSTGYGALFLWISGKSTRNADDDIARIRINGVTSGSYYDINQYAGSGGYATESSLNSTSGVIGLLPAGQSYTQVYSTQWIYIPVYNTTPAGGSYKKAWGYMSGMCSPLAGFRSYQGMGALQTLSGSVTSIQVFPSLGSWADQSSAYLYGLKST